MNRILVAGASFLIVGRPITSTADPRAAADAIAADIARARPAAATPMP